MGGKVCVVIPFYQNSEGLLRTAVKSVLDQRDVDNVMIVIVDDGSPMPARRELEPILANHADKIMIIEQKNAGAPAASNKGLDSVPGDTDYVAFLDSDDEWSNDHLANALSALENGYDFYFSDFYQLGQNISAFNRAQRITVDDHPKIEGYDFLHEYQGDMVDQIIKGNILGVSVTVYNYRRMPEVRYREDFRHTGMEYLLWVDLAKRSQKIAFSSKCECRYGAGVNIFSEASWGTTKFLTVITDSVKFRKILLREYSLTNDQRHFLVERIWSLRSSFVKGAVHLLLKGKVASTLSTLAGHAKVDPTMVALFLPMALALAYEKMTGRERGEL